MLSLLIISDDALAGQVGKALAAEGIEATRASSGAAALQLARVRQAATIGPSFDVIIIDPGLSDPAVPGLADELAAACPGVPVVDLVGPGRDVGQLLDAIHRSLDRTQPEVYATTVGPWRLAFRAGRLWIDGERVLLSGVEVRIVELLARCQGEVLSKEAILAHLNPDRDGMSPRILDVFLTRIRRIIRHHLRGHLLVRTVWGKGYVLDEGEPEAGS